MTRDDLDKILAMEGITDPWEIDESSDYNIKLYCDKPPSPEVMSILNSKLPLHMSITYEGPTGDIFEIIERWS